MNTEKLYAALRRIAVALRDWDDCDVINFSDDCERLQQRYTRHQRQGESVVESALRARVEFMADVLNSVDDKVWFTCSKCGGQYFGSRLNNDGSVAFRVCNDEFGRLCNWRGSTANEGMNIDSAEAADAKPE